MNKFVSTYCIGELVEYDSPEPGENIFVGRIDSVRFWKSDAANYTHSYTIYRSNSNKIDEDIREQNIHAVFQRSET